jgi:hypothetical protein
VPTLSDVDLAAARSVVEAHGAAGALLAAYGVPVTGASVTVGDEGVPAIVEVVDDPSFGPIVGFGVGLRRRRGGDRPAR